MWVGGRWHVGRPLREGLMADAHRDERWPAPCCFLRGTAVASASSPLRRRGSLCDLRRSSSPAEDDARDDMPWKPLCMTSAELSRWGGSIRVWSTNLSNSLRRKIGHDSGRRCPTFAAIAQPRTTRTSSTTGQLRYSSQEWPGRGSFSIPRIRMRDSADRACSLLRCDSRMPPSHVPCMWCSKAISIRQRRSVKTRATDQDRSALAAIRSTERGVMQFGLMRGRRGSPHLASPCDRALRILRGTARLALCCEPRRVGRDMPVGPLLVGLSTCRSHINCFHGKEIKPEF